MKRSLKRILHPGAEEYDGVGLEPEPCQKPPELGIFELISLGDDTRLRSFIMKNPNSLNSVDNEKATPLHFAAASGNLELLMMITDESSDEVLNVMDYKGNTPLHWAVEKNQMESVRFLLSRGANPNILNYYLLAPLHLAVQLQHNAIVEVLVSHSGIDIDLEGELGNTPLMMTCCKDNSEALNIL
ncbi:transient receptor potential cation channel subfamily A member 1-like, partial [Rhinatrema bivittatum]